MTNSVPVMCSARNARGEPCWAPITHHNPLGAQLPLCWAHLALVALAHVDQRRKLRPERALHLIDPIARVS